MSEPSPEAAVAGQAAAAAVEELQSREEVSGLAQTALGEAAIAAETAESAEVVAASAEMVAATASDEASIAADIAVSAGDTAVQALETAEVATIGVNELYQQFCDERDANAAFRESMASYFAANTQPVSTGVEEVSVTDDSGTGNPTSAGTGTAETAGSTGEEAGAQANPDQARRRLRHRAR